MSETKCRPSRKRELQLIPIRMFLGRRYSISGLHPAGFPGAGSKKKKGERKKKEPVSQHPLSSWTNITASSIPAAAALGLISFALALREMRTMCFMCCIVQPAWTWTWWLRLFTIRLIPLHFLCLETGRSNCRCSSLQLEALFLLEVLGCYDL